MASSEDHIMDYQEFNSEEKVFISDYIENSSQFESPAAIKWDDSARESALDTGLDLKNCEFDVLLTYLSNTVIFKNIIAIYYFLKGQKDQIEFPGANLYLQEFLVRIVRNVEVLRSKRFTLYCTLYCNFIIDLLKNALSNKNFMVACICKNEEKNSFHQETSHRTLIYKKLYYTSHYETQMQVFKGRTTIMSMSSTPPISRATSMEALHTKRSNFDAKQLNPFISHCLHLILNFVKDQTQLTLNFSGLSKNDTVFLHSVFRSAIDEKFDNGILCKKVHHAIWEAVKICSLKFEYRIRNLTFCLSKKSLLLEKRTKRPAVTDVIDGPSRNWKSKRKQKQEKNQAYVSQFSLDFIDFCLKKMLEFLTEDSVTSLIVSVSTAEEKKFLKNILNNIRSPAVRSVFTDELRRIIEQVNVLLNKDSSYKLKVSGKNKLGKNNVRFMKVPKFPVYSFQQQHNGTCSMGAKSSIPEVASCQNDNMPRETKNISPSKDYIAEEATNPPPEETPKPSTSCAMEPVDNPQSEDSSAQQIGRNWYPRGVTVLRKHGAIHKLNLTVPRIKKKTRKRSHFRCGQLNTPHITSSFQPAGTMDLFDNNDADPALTEAMRKHGISDNLNSSDDKDDSFEIIGDEVEDVATQEQSTPIQISNAMNMMIKMDWDGGALGASSNGILEPIMVTNDRNDGPRAGFGNASQLNNTNSRKATTIPMPCVTPRIIRMMTRMDHRPQIHVREKFLFHLLDFMSHNFEEMCLEFRKPGVNGDDLKFIISITHSLAARTCNIQLEVHEQKLFDNILPIFESQPDMFITAKVAMGDNYIYVKKIKVQGIRCHSIEARTKRFKEALLEGKKLPTKLEDLMQEYGPLAYSEESYEDELLAIDFLLVIFKLVKNNNQDLIYFERSMDSWEKNLFRDGVMFLNDKVCNYNENTPEAVLFELIQQHMAGCKYKLVVYDHGRYFSIFKNGRKPGLTHAKALDEVKKMNVWPGYDYEPESDEHHENDSPNDGEHYENDDENIKSKQEIDSTEKEEIIEEESEYFSETLNEGGSYDEMNTSDEPDHTANLNESESGVNENNSPKTECNDISNISEIASNVHLDEQIQTEKFDVKIVCVTIKGLFDKDTPQHIQGVIVYNIEKTQELPALICHGVHNDAIVYSCQTKNSYVWLLNTCKNHFFTSFTKEVDKMTIKINSYYKMKEENLFHLLQKYNKELSTKDWVVLNKGYMTACSIFDVKMDQKSINFILESNMSLNAGIDRATFSILF